MACVGVVLLVRLHAVHDVCPSGTSGAEEAEEADDGDDDRPLDSSCSVALAAYNEFHDEVSR